MPVQLVIGDLPTPVLQHILLLTATTHENLLRFVAACARVCADWRWVVGGSVAYGLALPWVWREGVCYWRDEDDERARVLMALDEMLRVVVDSDGEYGSCAWPAWRRLLASVASSRESRGRID